MIKFAVLFLSLLILSSPRIEVSAADDCSRVLKVLSGDTAGRWSALGAEEQSRVAETIYRFLKHSLHHSRIDFSENLNVFAGLMEHVLKGPHRRLPEGQDTRWLVEFLDDLISHSTTASESRRTLEEVKGLVLNK